MGDVAVASHARHKGHAVHGPSNCLSVCLLMCPVNPTTATHTHNKGECRSAAIMTAYSINILK